MRLAISASGSVITTEATTGPQATRKQTRYKSFRIPGSVITTEATTEPPGYNKETSYKRFRMAAVITTEATT